MKVAILESHVVANVVFAPDLISIKSILGDNVVELEHGYGIGDSYDTNGWHKAPAPEPIPSAPTDSQRIAELENTNRQQAAKIAAQAESLKMLEDCLVEMAGTVYA